MPHSSPSPLVFLFFHLCRQWLSCAHIGLGAFLTSISNLCALVSVPVTLHLYMGHVLNERFALAPSDVLLYTFAYTAPILAAACLAYIFVPSDAEIHWRWRLLAILTLVFFSFLAFVFVGNKPLGMTINPWELLAGHRARDYAACLLLLVANFFMGYGAGRFFKLPSVVCRTLSIEVAMQNDWLALHIVRGTLSGGQLFLFPIILYSTMQAMSGSMVMLIFKQMYTEERVLEYINENRLHDSFRGPGHFDADDANQVSLQGRHNKAVQKIFGMKMPTRYAKSSWFLRDPTKAVNRNESLTTYENDHGSDDDER